LSESVSTLGAPKTLFVEITTECNLRCRQCHMWLSQEASDTLNTVEKLGLVKQFAQMAPAGGVVLTGGEPFTKPEEVFALSGLCRALDLLSVVNTNGTTIPEGQIPRLLSEGPRHLVISLDSHRAALHDHVRGVTGSFDTTMRFVDGVLDGRRRVATDIRVYLSGIIFDRNIAECTSYIEFARELGVDGVTFQMLDRTFHLQGKVDKFFRRHWFSDPEAAKAAIDEIASRYEADPFLLLDQNDLRSMKAYIDHPLSLPDAVCGAHERNLVVDMHGNVQLCSYMTTLSGGRSLGNVREMPLLDIWNSEFADRMRPLMAACRRSCGMLNCNRKAAQ
jgi:radical SAM protein with 4Fe4S-binding SPASM domain